MSGTRDPILWFARVLAFAVLVLAALVLHSVIGGAGESDQALSAEPARGADLLLPCANDPARCRSAQPSRLRPLAENRPPSHFLRSV